MKTHVTRALLVASGLAVLAPACTMQAGLSNAPSIQRQRQPVSAHDAISNGPESCGNGAAGDPLPGRVPPCGEGNPMQATGR